MRSGYTLLCGSGVRADVSGNEQVPCQWAARGEMSQKGNEGMDPHARREPVLNAPGVIIALLGVLVLVHVVLTVVLAPAEANFWMWRLAFVPARYGADGANMPGGLLSQIGTPFTHMLVHGDWVHLGFNGAWLLAFGSVIARRMATLRFLTFLILSGLGGALVFYLANQNAEVAMVGASGAVSGLMGGVFRFLFNTARYGGYQVLREQPRLIPLMPLAQALVHRGVLTALGLWLGLNLLFATDFASLITEGEIAWEAHVGGFLVGFFFIGLFDQAYKPVHASE